MLYGSIVYQFQARERERIVRELTAITIFSFSHSTCSQSAVLSWFKTEFWQFNPFARLYSCILLDLRARPYLKKHQRAYNSFFFIILLHSGFISTQLSTNMHRCVHQDEIDFDYNGNWIHMAQKFLISDFPTAFYDLKTVESNRVSCVRKVELIVVVILLD